MTRGKALNMSIKDTLHNSFKKPELADFLGDISSILDPQDVDVVFTRGKGCELLFVNAKAQIRMNSAPASARANSRQEDASSSSEATAARKSPAPPAVHGNSDLAHSNYCKTAFAEFFPGLCALCSNMGNAPKADGESFEIKDTGGRTYIAGCNTINWSDGKPVKVLTLREISAEKELMDRLYALAYTDQLTGVPNRQKLKEDFAAIGDSIARGETSGIIALFDLDYFKAINDTYGHNTGDIVLRRLTEHLQSESAFFGHLYRLGGDEFVLFYHTPSDSFESFEQSKEHYNKLLSTALRAYTLPNIDIKCTLSIGVSFFPKHGDNLSEVLRKADIALYKAKAQGRNRVVIFEDQYDSAQKFKDLYITIQPVLLSGGKTFGYELIDRATGADDDDGTVSLNEFNSTLDALGLGDLQNDAHYFIPYSKQLLNPTVLKNLPREKFVVQINMLVRGKKTDQRDDLQTIKELRKYGYKLALTGVTSAGTDAALVRLADYCKFSASDKDKFAQKKIIAANPGTRFIATNVDSQEAYRQASAAGFHLFQGFYFNQPVIGKKTKEISPMKVNYFRLLKLCSTNDYLDFKQISSVVSSDVALSYKLLRILNSAAVGLRNVSSVANAVTYMGEESMKKWIAVLALRGIAEDKPLELVRMSLIRARFGELLAPLFRVKRDPQQVFMVGMLSLLHIALEMSNEELLEDIPVSDDIRESLLTRHGIYSGLLRFFENYEYANWEAVSEFVEENQLDATFVYDTYIKSVKWYNDLETS